MRAAHGYLFPIQRRTNLGIFGIAPKRNQRPALSVMRTDQMENQLAVTPIHSRRPLGDEHRRKFVPTTLGITRPPERPPILGRVWATALREWWLIVCAPRIERHLKTVVQLAEVVHRSGP